MTTLPENIPEYFRSFRSTIKETSMPNSKIVFIDSDIEVIDFDKVKNDINKNLKSNDALIIKQNNKWIFIEFKSGFIIKDTAGEINVCRSIRPYTDILFPPDSEASVQSRKNQLPGKHNYKFCQDMV